MTPALFIDILLFALAVSFWLWFGARMNGIHAETKRAADAMDAMNKRELQTAAKARAAEQARLDELMVEPANAAEIAAESARIREETRRRAGL
jgi:hypothetical protein